MKRSGVRPEPTSLRRWHVNRERSLDLLSIDDATWEALAAIRQDFTIAKSRNDDEALLRFVDYGAELLTPQDPNAAENDWTDWTDLPDPQGDADRNEFFRRYTQAKTASGLKTQRQIADAAGLSPTTVHAIEAGRIKPQFRTIEKLAAAFGVAVTELLGADSRPSPASGTTDPSPGHSNRRRIGPPATRKRAG
jgi:DNA-binding XRE family transcriptional regulator